MATSTANSSGSIPPVSSGADAQSVDFIHEQLKRTAWHVKLVDLFASLFLLASMVLVYLLAVSVLDGWVVELGVLGRLTALLLLLGGTIYFLVVRIAPLFWRRINPVYAARTIEKSEPWLKNSLINFLLLRRNRASVHNAVYSAVQQRAASDLSHVPVDASVDHTGLFRLGYMLAGIMAVFALYKMFSPKDPFQTIARVMAPMADVSRPARVTIEKVQPGNQQAYVGQQIAVTADIDGLRDDDEATLVYRVVDDRADESKDEASSYRVAMTPQDGGYRFTAMLPPDEQGLQHDVVYHIEAGDARSEQYRLEVLPAPAIAVEQLQYEYPRYTNLPTRTVQNEGHIHGLEGTRVTIRARANQPIKAAYLEFDTHLGSASKRETLDMQSDGKRAWCMLPLRYRPDGKTPRHASYRVRFLNQQNVRNTPPDPFKIEVTRDLPPDVEILTPRDDLVEVPENSQQKIVVRSIDPDFALSKIVLRGEAKGKKVLDETLLSAVPAHQGQAVVNYNLRPRALGLKEGDVLTFRAHAFDNRTSPASSAAEPNEAKTRSYRIRVTAPKKAAAAGPGDKRDVENNDPTRPRNDRDPRLPKDPPAKTKPDEKDPSGGDSKSQSNGSKQDGKQDQNNKQDASGDDKNASQNNGGKQEGDKGDSQGSQKSQGNQGGNSTSGKGDGADGQQSSDKGQDGQQSGKGDDQGGNTGQGGAKQDGAGQSKQGGKPGQPGGEPGQDGDSTTGQSGDRRGGGQSSRSQEPLHDGDVIERALKHRQEQQRKKNSSGAKQGDGKQQGKPRQDGGDGQKQPNDGKSKDGQKNDGNKNDGQTGNPQGDGAGGQKRPGQKQDQDGAAGSDAGDKKTPMNGGGKQGDQGAAGDKKEQPGGGNKDGDKKPAGGGQNDNQRKQGGGDSKQDGGNSGQDGQKKQGSQGSDDQNKNGGKSGAGQRPKDKSGAGKGDNNGGGDKKKKDGGNKSQQGDDGKGSSRDKKQSDSQGGDNGDRKGGGKQGKGQGSKQSGNDQSGGTTPADQGAGKSDQRGMGETGEKPGSAQQAEGKTGSPSQRPGSGDPSGKTGDKSGSKNGSQTDKTGGKPRQGDAKQSARQGSEKGNRGGTGNQNLADRGGDQPSDPSGADETPLADKADLEHARKATDLALEYLKDQKDNRELLDKLNMSQSELDAFLRRWEKMKQAARRSGSEGDRASRDLDETLRSLGLRPEGNKLRQGGPQDDKFRKLRDDGDRSQPPADYLEHFRAFKKSAARSRRD